MGVETPVMNAPLETPRPTLRSRWASVRWIFDRIGPIERLLRIEGDIAAAPAFGMKLYFINEPGLIEECLVARHRDFHKDPYYGFLRLILGNGLLTSEEDFHLRQRRMIQPAFHKQRIQAYGETMVHYSAGLAGRWQDGQRVDMTMEMAGLALSIVGKTLFNSETAGIAEEVAHALDVILPVDDLYLAPWGRLAMRLPLPQVRRFHAAIASLDRLLFRMIAEHKASGDQGDLLSMLLAAQDEEDRTGMSERQVRDEALTLFLAGHETTAIALSWTWYCLSQHPEAEARLHAELDAVLGGRTPSPEDYPRLDYTRRVFAETMRLFPPAYMIGRSAVRDTQLGRYAIPKEGVVIMSQYIMHRDPRYWPEPGRFDPDRFLDAAVAARPKFAYFPFGGGRRLCIGEPFAWMEGVLVLATLAQRWRARLAPGHRIGFSTRVTLRPKGGMPMTLERRGARA